MPTCATREALMIEVPCSPYTDVRNEHLYPVHSTIVAPPEMGPDNDRQDRLRLQLGLKPGFWDHICKFFTRYPNATLRIGRSRISVAGEGVSEGERSRIFKIFNISEESDD